MMVDEMDLLRDLRDAEPMRPHAYEEARGTLRSAMAAAAVSETRAVPETAVPETRAASHRRARWGTRRTVGAGAAVLVAAAAATALVVTSASGPGEPAPKQATANPILTTLVAEITTLRPKPPGDATLTIRNKSQTGNKVGDFGIDLRTDDGTYYWGVEKSTLRRAVAHKRGGDDHYKRNIAVAVYAVKGDMATARARMSVVHLPPGSKPEDGSLTPTAVAKLKAVAKAKGEKYVPPKPPTAAMKKEITDNRIWMNATDALVAAPGNPQVRAGVLRIMATMPKVQVAKTTTAGRPTLALTDSWPLGKAGTERLVVDARTGQPVSSFSGGSDIPTSTVYYHTYRVKTADIAAGRF